MTSQNNQQVNSLDSFNSLMNQASQAMSCDSACQTKKTMDDLKQKYLNAQTNLETAPEQVSSSRKNYMVFTDGQPAYDDYLDKSLESSATQIATTFKTTFQESSGKMLSNLNTYGGLLTNLKNVEDLYVKYKLENVQLIKQLKDDTSDVLTNERKTFYQDQGIDTLKFLYSYFLITIYVICVISFGLLNFTSQSNFGGVVRGVILVGLIILPFVCTRILAVIINIFYQIYKVLPKNVHLSA